MLSWPFRNRPARSAAGYAVQAVRRASRFLRASGGSAAMEFAFNAPPYFLLLFSLFEVGTTYLAGGALQNAANETARLIRTGQVQAGSMTQAQFRTQVCARLSADIMPCDQRLKIDVRRYTSFAGVNPPNALDSNGNWMTDFRFEPGAACDIVLVRLFYQWSTLTPGLGAAFANVQVGDGLLLQASAAFRNEPFTGAVC
jgi:Flp pilus assembly protein TadG